MRIYLITIISLLLNLFSSSAYSQSNNSVSNHIDEIDKQLIPDDSTVYKGVLNNGLTYYVIKNDNEIQQASFYLLVKAGSMVETENERGIAHFVEHMLFKGTKHFPDNNVIGFMNRNGIKFGHDSNAFTGFNTVRYMLKSIPTQDEELTDSCLLLLRDWANNATIDKKDVETERNVIVEEWRSKEILSFADKIREQYFGNSIYKKHSPIGDINIIQNCPASLIQKFYKRWYQPQNEAIVVIGDIEPDDIVEKIENLFNGMKRGKSVAPAIPSFPDTETPNIGILKDKFIPYFSVLFTTRIPRQGSEKQNLIGDMRDAVITYKIKDLMQSRLNGLKAKYNNIFNYSTGITEFGDTWNYLLLLSLDGEQAQWQKTMEILAKQIELIRRNGFTDEDLEPEISNTPPKYNEDSTAIVFVDSSYVAHKTHNDLFTRCADNFYMGDIIPSDLGIEMAKRYTKTTLTKEQLHNKFMDFTSGRNMSITLMFPENATTPTQEEVEAVYNRVRNMTDEELEEIKAGKKEQLERLDISCVDLSPNPGSVVNTTIINDSISEVMLSNGIKVVLMKMKTKDDHIYFRFQRPQGNSALSDEDFFYHGMLNTCLRKYTNDGSHSNVIIDKCNDTYETEAYNIRIVENYLKMLHATLVSTEIDSVMFNEKLKELQTSAIALKNPLTQSSLKVLTAPYASTKRIIPHPIEEVNKYNITHFEKVAKEYFSNFNGSMMVVQGEYDTDSIMPYILRYIASLPSKSEPVKRRVWESDHFKTSNTISIEKINNPTPYCEAYMYYTWEKGYKYTQETHAHNQVLQSILKNILINTLRIQQSDVYTPKCGILETYLPNHKMLCNICISCKPSEVERITKDIETIINNMADGDLITQELIDNCIKEHEKGEITKKGNDYTIRTDYINKALDGIVVNQGDISYIKQVTPESLKAHLKQLLTKGNKHIARLTTDE
ncbi:MAG: insulinase family protein [Bacteroidaceae bacterium]|nr:insulinase family protein [Bacteroidaceae bacterium]